MLKNIVELDKLQLAMWYIRIAFWIPKTTNTCSGFVILLDFPLQQWLQERDSMLCYLYIAGLLT